MGNGKTKILFVCLGNICRSPAAEGIMEQMVFNAGLHNKIKIDSAGTYGGHHGEMPDRRMKHAAANRGYNLTSRSRQIRTDDFWDNDLIIVMDDMNFENVMRLAPDPESKQKVKRMVDYSIDFDADHVPDPYYGGANGFEYVLDLLEDACRGLLEAVKEEAA